jgi:hypothetical protein
MAMVSLVFFDHNKEGPCEQSGVTKACIVKTPSTGCCYSAISAKLRSKCVNEYYVPPDDCSEMSTINWDSLFNGLEEGDAIALYIHTVE